MRQDTLSMFQKGHLMPIKHRLLAGLMTALLCACQPAQNEPQSDQNWTPLLDAELSQWERYLSFAHEVGYDGTPPKDEAGELIKPIGLNPTGYNVFTAKQEDGETVLRVSGKYYGALTTKESYRNYRLRLKFKWGEDIYDPRKKLLKDSGILYHAQGPDGAEHWRSWKLSQELQIMQGHLGDYWNQANSAVDVRAFIPEYIMSPAADLSQDFISVGAEQDIQGYVMRSANYEIPNDWNEIELITYEGQSLHIVNGKVVMALRNSRYIKDGKSLPLMEGQIQLQSEAAEIFYKDIEIKEIMDLPKQYRDIFADE